MAGNRIKGITIEVGGDTTKLDKALKTTDTQLNKTKTNLKDVERLLKMDPGNTELLAQKQRLLTDAVGETADRLRILESAARQANEQLSRGEITQQSYDALRREIIETSKNLEELNKTAADFDIDKAVQDAEKSFSGLGDVVSGAANKLGLADLAAGGAAFTIGGKLVEAAMAAVGWLLNLDEATEQYREAMGKLNTAFEAAGYGPETAKKAYEEFYKVLGDIDTATEASQLLAQLAKSEEDMAKWIEIAAGVYGTFGDALPIEGLIEAANETAKVGKVTGVLADALNWVGMSEDEFNESLLKTADAGDRARLIMNNLGLAYEDAAESFYRNNEALIATRENQAQLDAVQAQLGESVALLKSEFFDLFGPLLIGSIQSVTGLIWGIQIAIDAIGGALDWLGQKVQAVVGFFQDLFGASKQASNISVPEGSSKSRSALSEPYSLRAATAENLPYLAQGTVTRPNRPFMAVIGDNPNEPEVVSPLSTIERAVRNVMGEGGGRASNIRVTVNFTGSAAQLVRMLQPQIVAETNRLGPQFVI